jgi:hypothetical protein
MIQLGSRLQPDPPPGVPYRESYYVFFEPGRSRAAMAMTGHDSLWTERTDLSSLIRADDWNSISLRLQGSSIWLLVNGEPTLFYSDPSLDRGPIYLNVFRRSISGHPVFDDDPNDTTEVAVVARNLRVSALADGDPTRMPTYQRP